MRLVCFAPAGPSSPHQPGRGRVANALEWIAVALLFLALTLWYTFPLWRHPASFLVAPSDPLHNASVSWWLERQWLSGRLRGAWDLPPYFFPTRHALALDDPQIGVTLLGLPVFAATHSAIAAYNTVALLSLPLCALGSYALARHLTGSRGAALVAGIAWGFGAWHSGQAAHQQILSLECLPWALLMLHRYAESGGGRFLVGLFLFWTAQEYLCHYWGAFLFLLVLRFALVLLRVCAGLSWRMTTRAVGVIFLAGMAWLPGLWPSFTLTRHPHHAMMIQHYSADLTNYLPAPGTWLWGAAGLGGTGESAIAPGVLVLALAAMTAGRLLRPCLERPASATAGRIWAQIGARMPFVLILLLILRGLMGLLGVTNLSYFHLPFWVNTDTVARAALLGALLWANAPVRAWLRRHCLDWRSPWAAYAFLACLAVVWSCGYQVNAGAFLWPLACMGWSPGCPACALSGCWKGWAFLPTWP